VIVAITTCQGLFAMTSFAETCLATAPKYSHTFSKVELRSARKACRELVFA